MFGESSVGSEKKQSLTGLLSEFDSLMKQENYGEASLKINYLLKHFPNLELIKMRKAIFLMAQKLYNDALEILFSLAEGEIRELRIAYCLAQVFADANSLWETYEKCASEDPELLFNEAQFLETVCKDYFAALPLYELLETTYPNDEIYKIFYDNCKKSFAQEDDFECSPFFVQSVPSLACANLPKVTSFFAPKDNVSPLINQVRTFYYQTQEFPRFFGMQPLLLLAILVVQAETKQNFPPLEKRFPDFSRLKKITFQHFSKLEESAKRFWFGHFVQQPRVILNLLELGMFDGVALPKINFDNVEIETWVINKLTNEIEAESICGVLLLAHWLTVYPNIVNVINQNDVSFENLTKEMHILKIEVSKTTLKELLSDFKKSEGIELRNMF